MGTLAQVCYAIATLALLGGSGAGFAAGRLGRERMRLDWRWGALVGVGALLVGVVYQGISTVPDSPGGGPLLSSVSGRAALMALVAGLLSVSFGWRQNATWAELIPITIVAGIGALGQSATTWTTTAPLLLVSTLVSAGFVVWSAGYGLSTWVTDESGDPRKEKRVWIAGIALAGLTVNVVLVGGVNWWFWGTPGGPLDSSMGLAEGYWYLVAVWLLSAARVTLAHRSVGLVTTLDFVIAALLVTVALSVQWRLPFR